MLATKDLHQLQSLLAQHLAYMQEWVEVLKKQQYALLKNQPVLLEEANHHIAGLLKKMESIQTQYHLVLNLPQPLSFQAMIVQPILASHEQGLSDIVAKLTHYSRKINRLIQGNESIAHRLVEYTHHRLKHMRSMKQLVTYNKKGQFQMS